MSRFLGAEDGIKTASEGIFSGRSSETSPARGLKMIVYRCLRGDIYIVNPVM